MKKFALFLSVLMCLVACKTDLTDIDNRLAEIEAQGNQLNQRSLDLAKKSKELEEAIAALKKQSEDLMKEWQNLKNNNEALHDAIAALQQKSEELEAALTALRQEGDTLADRNAELIAEWEALLAMIKEAQETLAELEEKLNNREPQMLKMEFLAIDNPLQLVENTTCEIIGDSAIECRILNMTTDKLLIPRFEFTGDYVSISGKEVISGETQVDFSKPRTLTVYSNDKEKNYAVTVSSYTGLPTMWVEVNNRADISNSIQYFNATAQLVDNAGTRAGGDMAETSVKIKGVGTISWYTVHDPHQTDIEIKTMGKNAYTLLFPSEVNMLNEASSRTWDLRTNKGDITMLHHQTAFYMGKISSLDYTPRYHYVDFMLNGRYYGTYMLGDHLDAATARVNVGSDGFILNISSSISGPTFSTAHLEQPVSIVAPSSLSSEARSYITNYVTEAENALFSSNFTDVSTGWQKYMDMDSFVDWFLINEIAMNNNGAFRSDCIMNMSRGGKLRMGPLWDFEKAFGNASNNAPYSGFVIKNVMWYARLFQDPAFVSRVKERFYFFYDHQGNIIDEINANAQYLKYAIKEDDEKWNTFRAYNSSSYDTWSLYQGYVTSMKTWLANRMLWLKVQIDAM